MARKLTNPDGSYFTTIGKDKVYDQEPSHWEGEKWVTVHGWYQDPNGWWKNANPRRAGEPIPAPKGATLKDQNKETEEH